MKIMKASILSSIIALAAVTFQQQADAASKHSSGLPSAKAGQCFARVKKPAVYKTQSRKVLTNQATAKRVLIRKPQYRWINKKVLIRKAIKKSYIQPAKYKTTVKRVLIKPAFETWQEGHGAITRIDNMTGQIMCRVMVPAVYKNKKKRVLVNRAKIIHKQFPAVYKTVKHKVYVSPALYKTVKTPARYKTQNYRVKASGASYSWKPILCQTNSNKTVKKTRAKRKATKALFKVTKISMVDTKKIQEALKGKGFDPGDIDGQMGPGTATAVYAFQKSRGLPVGQVTQDTSRALGLIP